MICTQFSEHTHERKIKIKNLSDFDTKKKSSDLLKVLSIFAWLSSTVRAFGWAVNEREVTSFNLRHGVEKYFRELLILIQSLLTRLLFFKKRIGRGRNQKFRLVKKIRSQETYKNDSPFFLDIKSNLFFFFKGTVKALLIYLVERRITKPLFTTK